MVGGIDAVASIWVSSLRFVRDSAVTLGSMALHRPFLQKRGATLRTAEQAVVEGLLEGGTGIVGHVNVTHTRGVVTFSIRPVPPEIVYERYPCWIFLLYLSNDGIFDSTEEIVPEKLYRPAWRSNRGWRVAFRPPVSITGARADRRNRVDPRERPLPSERLRRTADHGRYGYSLWRTTQNRSTATRVGR